MEFFKSKSAEIINTLFQSFLVAYLVLLLIEQIWSGSVSFYLNLNYLLVVVIITGILDVFSTHPEQKSEKVSKKDYIFVYILGILGFIIIKFKTGDLGWLSWVISIIAGVLIILLSILVLEEDEPLWAQKNSKKSFNIGWKNGILTTIGALILISVIITLFSSTGFLESLRIVFGSVYVLFLPGFIISYLFFPKTKDFDSEESPRENEKGAIDWIERIALSFALSIAIVPLVIFYLNLIGIKISLLNSFLTILGIILISLFILRKKIAK